MNINLPRSSVEAIELLLKARVGKGEHTVAAELGVHIDRAAYVCAGLKEALPILTERLEELNSSADPINYTFGWGPSTNGRKIHFYIEERALCRRAGPALKQEFALGGDKSSNNCVECYKAVSARFPEGSETQGEVGH